MRTLTLILSLYGATECPRHFAVLIYYALWKFIFVVLIYYALRTFTLQVRYSTQTLNCNMATSMIPLPWIESDIRGRHYFTYLTFWGYPFVSPTRCDSTTLFQCNGGPLTAQPRKPGGWWLKCVPHKQPRSAF